MLDGDGLFKCTEGTVKADGQSTSGIYLALVNRTNKHYAKHNARSIEEKQVLDEFERGEKLVRERRGVGWGV